MIQAAVFNRRALTIALVTLVLLMGFAPTKAHPVTGRSTVQPDATYVFQSRADPPPFPESMGPSEQRDSLVTWEARKAGVPPELAVAVCHVENWGGDSTAVSTAGAVGICQVMPSVWDDNFNISVTCGFSSLFHRQRNACTAVRIMRLYFEECGDWNCALRKYHGSIRNRPFGDWYVVQVMRKIYRMDLSQKRDATFLATRSARIGT